MPQYVYVVRYPPESAEGLESRLADVEWKRTGQDLDIGAIELQGTFDDEETAILQLGDVFPELEERDAQPTIVGLAAFPEPGGFLHDVMGIAKPVPKGDPPVAVGIPIRDGVSKGEPARSSSPADKDQQAEPAAADEKPKVIAPEIGATAQNIEAGLKAIGIRPELWKSLPSPEKKQLSKVFLKDLYEQRKAYGRSVRWTFASDSELVDLAANTDARGALARDLLKVRAGIAQHQIAAATEETNLRKEAVNAAVQETNLREEVVKQQEVVTDILKELLAHFRRWRALSVWGTIFLGIALFFSMGLLVWLFRLARDDKISEWALPTAIFALALFVISPAVLLLRERPLKGLDEAGWPGAPTAGAAPAATTPAANAPATTEPAATAPAATVPAHD